MNTLYKSLIAILLAVIGFFFMATYNKIIETNTAVIEIKLELAKIQEKNNQFVTYQDCVRLIDEKIRQIPLIIKGII